MKQYSTDEYEVSIDDPAVDAEATASTTSVSIPCEAIPDGEYLVSLEVNGTVIAHRELMAFASGSCAVGDYTLAYSSYAVTVSTTEEDDVVRLKVEPVKVIVYDAMKAAVAKAAPKSEGGSSGGVLVVTETDGTLDKTWQEIHDAMLLGGAVLSADNKATAIVDAGLHKESYEVYVGNLNSYPYSADSASGYPTLSE